MRVVVALSLLFLCGCAVQNGKRYPVFGFGWVTVGTNSTGATAVKTTLVGGGVTTLPPAAIIGWSQTTCVVADTNVNVLIEIK